MRSRRRWTPSWRSARHELHAVRLAGPAHEGSVRVRPQGHRSWPFRHRSGVQGRPALPRREPQRHAAQDQRDLRPDGVRRGRQVQRVRGSPDRGDPPGRSPRVLLRSRGREGARPRQRVLAGAVDDLHTADEALRGRDPRALTARPRPLRRSRLTLPAMDRRIFGLENEYGVTCTFRGQRRLSPDEVARYLFRRVVHWGRSSNVFLENGARLYLDVGSHPEYATPECDSIEELVAHDKAGERILEHLLSAAEMRLHEEGISGEVYLFKNNTDSAGNSYGCHENYLVARHGEFARMADVPIPFFVTRQIWCGAGKVLH